MRHQIFTARQCEQSVNQLPGTQPTHAVAVFDEDDRDGSWRRNSYLIIKRVTQCLMTCELPEIKAMLFNLEYRAGTQAVMKQMTLLQHWQPMQKCRFSVTIISTDKGYCHCTFAIYSPWLFSATLVRFRVLLGWIWWQTISTYRLLGINESVAVSGRSPVLTEKCHWAFTIHPDLESLYQHIDDVPTKWQNKLITHKVCIY